MSIDAIAPLGGVAVPRELSTAAGATAGGTASFGQLVMTGLEAVDQQVLSSQAGLQQIASGDVQNLHQVMIRMEESRLSFQLMMQVRNRLLEAYQDVMRMQV